jgi:hypothetical protein
VLAAAITLVAVATLGWWLLQLLPPRAEAPPAPPAVTATEDLAKIVRPLEIEPPKPDPAAPAAVPSIEPGSPPPAVPKIVRMEPEEPQPGDRLTLELARGLDGERAQFRTSPRGEWQEVSRGRVHLVELKPGPLTIELRTIDDRGRTSAIEKRIITVRPPPAKPLPKPPPKVMPPESEPDWKEGDRFYQEVAIGRISRYRIPGLDLELGQQVRYILVSSFAVRKKDADGTLHVDQKVESVQLAEADRTLQAQLEALLRKTKGATFHFTLNPRRTVVRFEGGQEALRVFTGGNPLGGTTFLLWSFLDQDGWKELAEVSFFRPRDIKRKDDRWTRPLTHSWGPLGHWEGLVGYIRNGHDGGRDRYDYALDLAYRPPAVGAGAGLPFKVGRADFRIKTAAGAIAFDADRGRVSHAEERFHVRGVLAVSALGVETAVEMDEMQIFQLRHHDRNPLENK